MTGATTSELGLDAHTLVAFATAFLGTAALWWLYFTGVARIAEMRLRKAGPKRTAMARDAYTYLHVVLVAAIVVSAVGDELVIAHPGEPLETAELVAVVAGPALYLLAHALFRLRVSGTLGWRRPLGAAVCGRPRRGPRRARRERAADRDRVVGGLGRRDRRRPGRRHAPPPPGPADAAGARAELERRAPNRLSRPAADASRRGTRAAIARGSPRRPTERS